LNFKPSKPLCNGTSRNTRSSLSSGSNPIASAARRMAAQRFSPASLVGGSTSAKKTKSKYFLCNCFLLDGTRMPSSSRDFRYLLTQPPFLAEQALWALSFLFPKPYARPSAVLGDKLYAGSLECGADGGDSLFRNRNLPFALRSADRRQRQPGSPRNVGLRKVRKMTPSSDLRGSDQGC
jgi:hypothetical protein